jgi:hypothetical protein
VEDRKITIVLIVLLAVGVLVKFYFCFQVELKNDMIYQELVFHDFFKGGNHLLKNWYIARNNYLFSDFPFYLPFYLVTGLSIFTIHLANFMMVLLMAVALWFALKWSFGQRAALLGCAAFFLMPLNTLFVPNHHVGVVFWMLVCMLAIQWLVREERMACQGGTLRP